MIPNSYSNFELEFDKVGEEYIVRARSFAGEANHKFSLPFTVEAIKEFILGVERSISKETQKIDTVKKFGRELFEAVFQNDVRALLKSSLDLIQSKKGEGLRIRLHLQNVPELAHFPWEYLYQTTTNEFLCLKRQTPIVRYLDIPKMIPRLQIKPPVRILVMISSPKDLPQLDINTERNRLRKALAKLEKKGLIEINVLEEATVNDLQRTLRRTEFHIFHFIGHGDFDQENDQGLLAFENEDESVDYVNAEQLGAILNNHKSLRLAVLNSCEGARTSLKNPFAGTAKTLTQQGFPAVVAMQFSISDVAAVKFASTFYAAVADGLPADTAVAEARVTLFSSEDHIEWGTPVLFMRSADGSLFSITKRADKKPFEEEPPKTPFYRRPAVFLVVATLVFAAITFVVLAIIPKSSVVEIDVFAKQISFNLPEKVEDGEEVPLLYSGIWVKSISIERFQPLELTLDSTIASTDGEAFQNPLKVSPEPLTGRVTFSSQNLDISLQEMISDPASKVSLRLEDKNLYLEIRESSNVPYQTMSLGEYVNIAVQECTVKDGANNDFTWLFKSPVRIRVHDLSRSLQVRGGDGYLSSFIKAETGALFFLEQFVHDLDFNKNVFQGFRTIKQPTVDSVFVKRNFPLENVAFRSSAPGELDVSAEPNRFLIYDLSSIGNSLRVTAQGRLKSLKIGRAALMNEMIPGYLSVITQYPITSVIITWFGWFLTILSSLILKIYKRNRENEL